MAWHEKLKARLLVPIFIVLFVSMVATLSWLYFVGRERLLERAGKETALVSEVIKAGIRNQMMGKSPDVIQETVRLIQQEAGLREVSIVTKKGVVAYSSREDRVGKKMGQQSSTCMICHGSTGQAEKHTIVMKEESGERIFRSVSPIENQIQCRSCHGRDGNLLGVLIVDQHIGSILPDIKGVQKSLVAFGLITVVVIGGILFLIVETQVVRPLRMIMEGAKKIRAGNLDTRIDLNVRGEMSELGGVFNSMVEGIGERIGEIEEKNFELVTLYSMLERITRTINLSELRRIVLDIIMEMLHGVEYGVIVIRLADEERVELYSRRVHDERTVDIAFDPDDAEAYRTSISPAFMKMWLAGGLTEGISTDGESGLLLPLVVRERSLGFLYALKEKGGKFTERERAFMHALVSHISVSLANSRLYTIAITDELTGAFTIRYFQQALEDEVEKCQRYGQKVSLLMIDLDDFKSVNDGYGHPAGDRTLRDFCGLARDAIRDADVLCRYGGEEFAVILPETDSKTAMVIAERIRRRTQERAFAFEGNDIRVTVSVGVACCPGDGANVGDLVSASERALSRAKEEGKNRVVSW
ncbi:MAG: diguanylate cyclase [Deltaproteobacteria bacterium]|nr:diguanylate cyclase [Deltaproteobacteria bacterium]NIS77952.1 diguanylate cyclase [Deltaproteobacteria bacterium]